MKDKEKHPHGDPHHNESPHCDDPHHDHHDHHDEHKPKKEKKKRRRRGPVLFLLLALIILIALVWFFRNGFGLGQGTGDKTGDNDASNTASNSSDVSSNFNSDITEIRIVENDIYIASELCTDENDLKEKLTAAGSGKKYKLIHDTAIKETYDKVKQVLLDLKDPLELEIDFNE